MSEITRRLKAANSFLNNAVTELDIARERCQTALDGLPASTDRDAKGRKLIAMIDKMTDALDGCDEASDLISDATGISK